MLNATPPFTGTFVYVALPCEAQPLVHYWKLKKRTTISAFAVYQNQSICLTVTGLGKNAMSAAIAYTQALFNGQTHQAMLNIGIAGHPDHELGEIYLITKCVDKDSDKRHYPPILFQSPCATAVLQSAAKPQLDYAEDVLFDMEAAAFYEIAGRFTTGELIQSLKVISDNRRLPATNIQPKQVSALIAAKLPVIATVLTQLQQLAKSLDKEPDRNYDYLQQHFHFTAAEYLQWQNLAARWQVLTGAPLPEIPDGVGQRGRDLLHWLNLEIAALDFYL